MPCLGRENAAKSRNVALPQAVPSTSMSASRNFAASSANPVNASAMLRLRFLRLWVFDAEHSSTPPLIDVVNFQQCRRMVGRPSCRLWLDAAKAKPGQIKLIDKDIDRPVLSITIPPKQNAP